MKCTRRHGSKAQIKLSRPRSHSRDVILGVDVSSVQRNVEWKRVASTVSFAIIRVTDGVNVDDNFVQNWKEARKTTLKLGAYHFFRNIHKAQEQFNQIKQTLFLRASDFAPVLDIENTPKYKLKPQDVPVIGELMALIRDHFGALPIIYTNNGSWKALGSPYNANGISFVNCPLWIAYPTSHLTPTYPLPWTAWTLWQYSWKGAVSGITGDVDMDRYVGNRRAFAHLSLREMQRITASIR